MLAESEYTSILLTFKKLKWCLTLRVGLCKHQIPLKITWKRPLFWLWKNTVYLDGNICQEQTENVASSCYICFCKYKYTELGSSVICHLKHWVWERVQKPFCCPHFKSPSVHLLLCFSIIQLMLTALEKKKRCWISRQLIWLRDLTVSFLYKQPKKIVDGLLRKNDAYSLSLCCCINLYTTYKR